MYWQVYLHKTVIAGELMLGKILERSRELTMAGETLFATPALNYFLTNNINITAFVNSKHDLDTFASLDDTDIMSAIKVWASHDDFILSTLCKNLIDRHLYHVEITNVAPAADVINDLVESAVYKYGITEDEASYFVFTDSITNKAYKVGDGNIRILMKDGSVQDITKASDNSNLEVLAKTVKKYVLCHVKGLL